MRLATFRVLHLRHHHQLRRLLRPRHPRLQGRRQTQARRCLLRQFPCLRRQSQLRRLHRNRHSRQLRRLLRRHLNLGPHRSPGLRPDHCLARLWR